MPAGLSPASAERISNPIAEFTGVDKITGRIITFDVYIDETVQFGALQVTPRVCYSRPIEEAPRTDSFVEVDEITLDRKIRRIFTGWMFAESPGLNAVEHAGLRRLAEELQAAVGRARAQDELRRFSVGNTRRILPRFQASGRSPLPCGMERLG